VLKKTTHPSGGVSESLKNGQRHNLILDNMVQQKNSPNHD
jgi:hypothetical protein